MSKQKDPELEALRRRLEAVDRALKGEDPATEEELWNADLELARESGARIVLPDKEEDMLIRLDVIGNELDQMVKQIEACVFEMERLHGRLVSLEEERGRLLFKIRAVRS